jgi:uncharacterized RDD family membrane protein YckC
MGHRQTGSRRLLTGESLQVSRALVGRELASPGRRAAALALDYVVMLAPMLAVAIGAAALYLNLTEPAAYRAAMTLFGTPSPEQADVAWGDLAPVLVRAEMPGVPAEVELAVERHDTAAAIEALRGYDLMYSLNFDETEGGVVPEKSIRFEIHRLMPTPLRLVALFGVVLLYFTLCHASRRGQTLGKRLLGIRVVHLGGEKLSLFDSFERAAGLLEIPATLGLGLLSLWREPNRRLSHDRIVHTAVVRVERGA